MVGKVQHVVLLSQHVFFQLGDPPDRNLHGKARSHYSWTTLFGRTLCSRSAQSTSTTEVSDRVGCVFALLFPMVDGQSRCYTLGGTARPGKRNDQRLELVLGHSLDECIKRFL